VRTSDDRFLNLPGYPFAPRYVTVGDGLRMHYIDEGPTDAEPILLVHGQPTWSFLYRKVVDVLTAHGFRAIAPDLIGFGRSDKPTARTDYSVRAHTKWLGEFVEQLELYALTIVVQDWGGPIGLGALTRELHRLGRIVAANTPLHTADASLAGALTWTCHSTSDGDVVLEQALLDYQRLTQELPALQPSLFVQGATDRDVEPSVLAAYDAPFPDESYAAGARQFPILMGLTPGSECARLNRRTLEALGAFTGSFLTAFSDGDPSTRGWDQVLQRAVPGAQRTQHVVVADAGHFLQEDKGVEFGEIIARFMLDNPLS